MFITFFIVGGRQRGNEMRISRTDPLTLNDPLNDPLTPIP
jgi:hypothetical protein